MREFLGWLSAFLSKTSLGLISATSLSLGILKVIICDKNLPILGSVSFFGSGRDNRRNPILDKANENSFVAVIQIRESFL